MPPQLTQKRLRPRVTFRHQSSSSNNNNSSGSSTATNTPNSTERKTLKNKQTFKKTSSGNSTQNMASSIPALFTSLPPISDHLVTKTSVTQDETVNVCLPFLSGQEEGSGLRRNAIGIPHLDRDRHIQFLHRQLGQLPGAFKAMDPARPWIFYWCLAGLALLGEDVTSYRERLIETVRPMQNDSGGFAGGFGQDSHLATTYAIILSLALVGGEDAFEVVDRRSMWRWLGSLKQPDGGFQMSVGGEEDVRYVSFFSCPVFLSGGRIVIHTPPLIRCRDTSGSVYYSKIFSSNLLIPPWCPFY